MEVPLVGSLLGVILIARPSFLFGSLGANPQGDHAPEATPAQRLVAVG